MTTDHPAIPDRRDLVPAQPEAKPTLDGQERIILHAMGRSAREIGGALHTIQVHELHRDAGFERFEDYCQAVWQFSRQRAYQLIAFFEFVRGVTTAVDTRHLPAPRIEAQVRPLLRLRKPEDRLAVWADVVERYGERATGPQVEEAVDYIRALAEDDARRDRPREEVVRAFREGRQSRAKSRRPATIGTVGPPDPARDDPPPPSDLATLAKAIDAKYAERQALVADIAAYGTGPANDLVGNLRLLADTIEKEITAIERKAAAAQRRGGGR